MMKLVIYLRLNATLLAN